MTSASSVQQLPHLVRLFKRMHLHSFQNISTRDLTESWHCHGIESAAHERHFEAVDANGAISVDLCAAALQLAARMQLRKHIRLVLA